MELNNEIYSKLINLINDAKKNINYEFEARFWSKKKDLINEDNFSHTHTHSLHQSQADLHDMHAYAGLLESRVRDEQTRVRELEGDIHISAETRFRNEQERQLSETQLFKDNQSLFRDNSKMLEDIKGMARELELGNQAIRSLENEVRALKQVRLQHLSVV
jgi:hypothetical protein